MRFTFEFAHGINKLLENSEASVLLNISNNFNINIVLILLDYLLLKCKIEEINCNIFPNHTVETNEKILEEVKDFYDNFPRIYDLYIMKWFPNLFAELCFFNNHDLQLIMLDFSPRAKISSRTSVKHYYYLNTSVKVEKNIIVQELTPNNKLEISDDYEQVGFMESSIPYFEKTPILTSIKDLLEMRLLNYFKNKI